MQRRFSWFDRRWLGDRIELLSLYPTVEEQGLSGALELLLQAVRARRAQIVVIDGFRGLRTMAGDDLAVRRFIFDLAAKLNLLGVTCIFNGEYGRAEIDHHPEFTIADGIVWLSNDLVGVKHERWLEVVKLRGAEYLGGRHRFGIDAAGHRGLSPHREPRRVDRLYARPRATAAGHARSGRDARRGHPWQQRHPLAGHARDR